MRNKNKAEKHLKTTKQSLKWAIKNVFSDIYIYYYDELWAKVPLSPAHSNRKPLLFIFRTFKKSKHRTEKRIKRMKTGERTFFYEDRRFDNSVTFQKKSYLNLINSQ